MPAGVVADEVGLAQPAGVAARVQRARLPGADDLHPAGVCGVVPTTVTGSPARTWRVDPPVQPEPPVAGRPRLRRRPRGRRGRSATPRRRAGRRPLGRRPGGAGPERPRAWTPEPAPASARRHPGMPAFPDRTQMFVGKVDTARPKPAKHLSPDGGPVGILHPWPRPVRSRSGWPGWWRRHPAGSASPSGTTEAGPGRTTRTGCPARRARSRCPSSLPSCGWSRTDACTSPTRSRSPTRPTGSAAAARSACCRR